MTDATRTAPGAVKSLLHIAAAFGFAIVQPGYDLLARYPEFFVARKVGASEVLVAVAVLSLAIPVGLWLVSIALRWISVRLAHRYVALVIGLCAGAVVVQLAKQLSENSGTASILLGAVLGLAAALAYLRVPLVSSFLTLLSPAAVLFPVVFLFFSPVERALFSGQSEAMLGEVLGPEINSNTPVVFVVFDELPTASLMAQDRTIDGSAFPAFAALAREANWYRNATTVAAGSLNAIPAILTGRYPDHTFIPNAVDYPENVFAMLGRSYSVYSQEPITGLCSPFICSTPAGQSLWRALELLGSDLWVIYQHLLLPDSYTASLPAINENWMGFAGEAPAFEQIKIDKTDMSGTQIVHEIKKRSKDRVITASGQDYGAVFDEALDKLVAGNPRFLHFQHVQLPHVPWRYLPSGKQYRDMFVDGKEGNDKWINAQPWLMAQGLQRHLLQVKYVDALLGKLLDKLREIGAYDDALIIVTADHGASFKMGALRRTTTPQNIAEIAGVPLLVKFPGQATGKIVEDFVETVDIVPTIAQVLGIQAPWPMDGFSLLDGSPPRERKISVRSIYGQPQYLEHTGLKDREWLLDFKAEWFGPGNRIDNLFALGPGGRFVGRDIATLNAGSGNQYAATLRRPAQYERVYLHTLYSPSRVLGRIQSMDAIMADNQTILVGINGIIHGSGQLFTRDLEDGHFSVMVPSAPFHEGPNEVTLFLVDDAANPEASLVRIPIIAPEEE